MDRGGWPMAIMDLRGDWTITQSQQSVVRVHLDHDGFGILTGRASHDNGSKTSIDLTGKLSGRADEPPENCKLQLVIKWSHGPIGEYQGTFGPLIGSGS